MNLNKRDLPIANPCPASWEEMSGDDRQRFCAHCQKHVHNLSAMTQPEREAVLENRSESVCIAYEFRSDGNLVDRSFLARLRRLFPPLRLASWTALVALMQMGLTGCVQGKRPANPKLLGMVPPESNTIKPGAGSENSKTNKTPVIMGKIAPPAKQ